MKNITKEKLNELIERTKEWDDCSKSARIILSQRHRWKEKWFIYTTEGELIDGFRNITVAQNKMHELKRDHYREDIILVTTS